MPSILNACTILYVEDELEIQANVAEFLRGRFKTVYLAADGEKALELYHQHHPDVLLLDINLPKHSGLDVAKEIRQQDQTVKIVMLTAYTEKEKLLAATELKLTKYLIKPVAPKVFKETLEILAQELTQNPSRFLSLNECYSWDRKLEQLSLNSNVVNLTEKEHRLLKLFISNKGAAIRYEKIMTTVWEESLRKEISIDSIKNQVSKLRKKLPDDCIASVYGEGYILK